MIIAEKKAPLISINKSHIAEIEATYVTEKYTMAIKEYFQAGSFNLPEKCSISQTVDGKDMKIVFDYTTDKLFIVADNKCHFKNISVYLDDIFSEKIDPLVKFPVITSKDAMRLIQDLETTMVNESVVIRGIETSHWRYQLTKGIANLTIDTYFTNGWNSEAGTKQNIPVRYDVFGELKNNPFHVIYDFYFFQYRDRFWYKDEVAEFEMPTTVLCEGADVSAKLPEIADTYSYTVEIIDSNLFNIEISKVWYDKNNKLLRQDFHPSSYPLNGYPVTEIYDLKTDVVYSIDNILQNCSVNPIEQSKIDDNVFFTPIHKGKYINLQMRDPLAFLQNDKSFTYIEQRKRRDIMCDVFTSQQNISFPNNKIGSALFVFYFMSNDWKLYPDFGGPDEQLSSIPIMMEVFIKDQQTSGFDSNMTPYYTYNFIDFTNHVNAGVFSIPQCYSGNTEIYFKIGFPGKLYPAMMNSMRKKLHSLIADVSGIFPHRVQKLSIHDDSNFFYVRAAIIDRTKPEAQFSLIKNKKLKGNNVKTTFQKSNLHLCASKCISSQFSCWGFDLSNDGVCRLTASQLTDAASQLTASSTSNYYTRTVVGKLIKEPSAVNAWNELINTIHQGDFIVAVVNPSKKEKMKYTARTIELVFGVIDTEGNPKFPAQMSYRVEFSEPVLEKVNFYAVWYDSERKLLRLDERFSKLKAPFYSLNPLTTINDFSEGVSYHIDQILGNCTILPLADTQFDTVEQKQDNTTILRMKNPEQHFKMDATYTFYGQKTVRGILCDVYESVRTDFIVPGQQKPTISTFRYCFVNGNWADRSDTGPSKFVNYTPVQLEIISSVVNYYVVFNFFDFSDDILPIYIFDVQRCFERKKEYQFQITFSGARLYDVKYDPLEFIQQAEKEIAKSAKVNILRIQEAVLEYDSQYTYLTAKLLTYPPAKAHFRKFPSKVMNRKEDKSFSEVKSVDECANKCMMEKGFTCNSFDFCQDDTVSCKLSQLFSQDGKKLNSGKSCDHYSRVVAGGKRPLDPLIAIGLLKDAVARGTFKVTLNTVQTYTAIKLRDDVTTTDSIQLTMENNIKKFDRIKNDTTIVSSKRMRYYPQMSVDDCANLCLAEPTYKCESFAFCFSQGDCYLASSHPDQNPQMLEIHKGCSVYNRNYLYRYDKEPGVSTVTTGTKGVDVTSASDCAKHCTINDDFLCQSFQYCPQINECTLSKVHKMDIPDKEIQGNIMCDIYFRKYIDDFTASKGKRIALVNDQILTDISEEQCAKACMEEEKFNCASFDYCINKTECRLTNHDTLHSGHVTTELNAFCTHFRRKATAYSTHKTLKKGVVYSSSHLTAVALSALFSSFLFGTLFMTLYLRRKPTVSI